MDVPFKYEVYFVFPDMDNQRKTRILNYFRNKRKSGGGECGPMEAFKGNVYRIAFQDKKGKTQQRHYHISY